MIDDSVYILDPSKVQIAPSARIDRWCKLEGHVTIGEHVHVASFSHIGAGGGTVEFGDYSGCSSHVTICSGLPDIGYLRVSAADPLEQQHPVRKRTVIGRYVVIFAGAVIYPGVTIGDGALIGAGSVVTKDVPSFEVWGGVPSRKLRDRPLSELMGAEEYA